MDQATLATRLRSMLKVPEPQPSIGGERPQQSLPTLDDVLGGRWCEYDGRSHMVVDRRWHAETRYGHQSVGAIATSIVDGASGMRLLAGNDASRSPLVFFDLETTGLSGGAGTYAFLVGCGTFDGDGSFATRQFVLARPSDERQLLEAVTRELASAGTLVTFNGKSFDAPLIETRYLFHRLGWEGARLPHLDVLHPARRFWGAEGAAAGSCALDVLERRVLGAVRTDDVSGAEIPARYFQFIRSGEGASLAAVLEHNRLDLLSLAGLTARLLDLIRLGPAAARTAREALALGRVYSRHGQAVRAQEAYEQSIESGTLPVSDLVEALRSLALMARRSRRHDQAAARWRALLEISSPPHVAREASEALAIHHEHRARDLQTAKAFALRSLCGADDGAVTAWHLAVRHRLERIARKMNASVQLPLFPSLPLPPSSGFPTSGHRTSS